MKKFKFRLEKVLQYREAIKQEKLRDLLEANHRLHAVEEKLAMLERSQMENKSPDGGVMDVENFLMTGIYARRIREEIERERENLVQRKKEADEALAIYIEASKDTKTLETLKEKKKKEYSEYVLKEEEKFLDELTTQKRSSKV